MSDLEKALGHLADNIKKFRETDVNDGYALILILQQITGTLFYLEKERSDYHAKWSKRLNELVLASHSVSGATNLADVDYPEMYMLRRIMEAGYKVVEAIRSMLSWIKTEKRNAI